MSATTSTVSGVLKRVYDDMVEKQQNLTPRSINEIGKALQKYSPGGSGFFGAINEYGNEAVGAINETESFRTADNESYVQWKVSPKILTAPIEISGLLSKAAEGDEESFVNAVVNEADMARERLLSDENRQFFGLGTGLLASPTGAVASDVTSFTVDSAQYIRANMIIDIYQSTTKTVDSIRVSDVDQFNSVIYLATSLGAALNATSELVKENIRDNAASDGKEMMGLRGIVDDGTELTTFQDVDAATKRIWRGTRIDASSANLTSDLLQRLIDDVGILSGQEPDLLILHAKQRRKYLDLVVPEKRYMDQKLDAGFSKLSFNGKELFVDKDCQTDTVYAVKKSLLRKFELAPLEMGRHAGSDQFERVSQKDVYEAYWRHYCNFGTSRRNAHGKIVSLAEPSGVS